MGMQRKNKRSDPVFLAFFERLSMVINRTKFRKQLNVRSFSRELPLIDPLFDHQNVLNLIISITKFLIAIGHLRVFFLCNKCVVTWVSNYNFFVIG